MNRKEALNTLIKAKPVLSERFGVTRLALFGSTARDTADLESDIDVLVSLAGTASSAQYFGVQFFLEDQLGCRVDFVTEKALRPELQPYIMQEAIYV